MKRRILFQTKFLIKDEKPILSFLMVDDLARLVQENVAALVRCWSDAGFVRCLSVSCSYFFIAKLNILDSSTFAIIQLYQKSSRQSYHIDLIQNITKNC